MMAQKQLLKQPMMKMRDRSQVNLMREYFLSSCYVCLSGIAKITYVGVNVVFHQELSYQV